tara:strand:+ start:1741 stop:2751 length:1011 start_codon:yes stop_codon:yes gene_type:complete
MCVILFAIINGKKIFAKNRDRAYSASVDIIHEIVNGIEIVYIKDNKTCWIEGMNENGFGVVNSTLNVKDNSIVKSEKDKKRLKTKRKRILKHKHNIFYKALTKKNRTIIFNTLTSGASKTNDVVEGNSLVHYNDKVYHIENDINHKYKTRKVKEPIVFANHSKYTNKYGYTKGKRGMSSYLREKLTDQELQSILNDTKLTLGKSNAEIYDMILSHAMNSNYDNINVKNHPYRDKKQFLVENPEFDENKIVVKTTGQILQNFDDLEFVYRYDKNNSINKPKYINRLPKSYNPKIRVIIQETQKNKSSKKASLTNNKIGEIEKKFITKDSEQDIEQQI